MTKQAKDYLSKKRMRGLIERAIVSLSEKDVKPNKDGNYMGFLRPSPKKAKRD